MRPVNRLLRGRLHYGWVVAAVTFLGLITSAGIRSTPGVLIIPLEREFGWNRAVVSSAVSISLLLYGLCGPFAAGLMDRIGVRRVMLGSFALLALGVGSTTQMRAPWQLDLLWGLVVGMGTGTMALVLGAYVSTRWFVRHRGLVMGLFSASTATGQLVFLPFLAHLVVSHGWRAAAWAIVGAVAIVAPLVALFMRDDPQQIGLRPLGAEDEPSSTAPVPAGEETPSGAPRRAQAGRPAPAAPASAAPARSTVFSTTLSGLHVGLGSRDFLLLAGSFFICGASTNGLIGTHLIPAAMEHGIPEVTAAGLLAMMGIFDLIGTTTSGWLTDRWDSRYLLCWYYGLRGLALLFLPYALGTQFLNLAAFAVFYGLDWVATVPPTVRLAADTFGKRNVGIMFGWVSVAHQIGAATAAFGAGALRTWAGSYQMAFMTSGLLCLVAAGLVIRIGASKGDVLPPRPAEISATY